MCSGAYFKSTGPLCRSATKKRRVGALAWRDDFGSESYWAVELGKRVAARGADELWPLVASR